MELYLLKHYEDSQQLIPIICIGLALVFLMGLGFRFNIWTSRLFKLSLLACALSGFYGTYLHLMANYEFELEMTPEASTSSLFLESLSGALPSLAPLSMVVLALIGYSYLTILKQQQ